jgi:hypothetical protein
LASAETDWWKSSICSNAAASTGYLGSGCSVAWVGWWNSFASMKAIFWGSPPMVATCFMLRALFSVSSLSSRPLRSCWSSMFRASAPKELPESSAWAAGSSEGLDVATERYWPVRNPITILTG